MEVIGRSSNIFRRSKCNALRFVIQRHSSNTNLMAALATNQHADSSSDRSSRHPSVDTTTSALTSPVKNINKAKQSIEFMNLAFGSSHGPLTQQIYSTTLYRGSKGFGFAIMERSATNEEGIYIKQIVEGGPADKDGILCPGDQLIKINKKDVTHASYDTVVDWIRSAKHVLHVQVTRWGFNTQASAETKPSTKRFSDPSVLNTFTSVLLGASWLVPRQIVSRYRRASFPNIGYKREHIPTTVLQPLPNYSTTSINLQGDTNFDKISILINDEPEIEATIRPIKPGSETEISIAINNSCGLGIGCIGGCETALNIPVIHEIYPNGAAAKDGRLRPGDRISKVNRISLAGVPFLEAMNKLQMAYISKSSMIKLDSDDENENISLLNQEQSYLNLTIFRPTEQSQKWYDQELIIELLKKSGKGLGICIADRCVHLKPDENLSENENTLKVQDNSYVNTSEMQTSYGVIITEIIKGSIAATDGRLMANDQILEVNGKDTSTLTSEIVGALLKAAPYKVVLKVGRLKNQIAIPNSAAFLFNDPYQKLDVDDYFQLESVGS
ncbi:multiple pdz domain protein, putative [Schistosoma mansoni]|uniref:multiple pdz domain protein, putative n=1 Tax=Schistosoma mansoni TaxID=6183 RepID=UPI00022C82FB|nr:multiple pdz domain protein, putative [Schistosoma mansoni]|eukprot:XP_018644016.1 multiple pdz domain protein, putative [Schistosoma mansoni]